MINLDLTQIFYEIKKDKDCDVFTPLSNPEISLKLPSDLRTFYEMCNGVKLFKNNNYPYRILGIEELTPINLIITGELCPEDVSSNWIAIAEDLNGEYLSLDLSQEKSGWCYDSFHETHGLIGNTPVIAKSFTELLYRLYKNKGDDMCWFTPEFDHLYGDAYD